MKKITLLLLLVSSFMLGQNFPGNSPDLLIGKELKVLPKDERLQPYGYQGFFKDEALKKDYECCDSYNSKYKNMVNRIFKVTEVIPYKNSIGTEKYKLKLLSDKQETVYFEYDPKYDHEYPFEVVGGLTLPEDFYCRDIEKETDKFTNDITHRSPYIEGVSVIKSIKGDKARIYLAVNEIGSTLNVGKKGLILLLEGGQKIDKPDADLDVKVNKGGSGYVYSAFVELTLSDISLLTKYSITDNRLYVYDGTINNGAKIKEYIKCLTK